MQMLVSIQLRLYVLNYKYLFGWQEYFFPCNKFLFFGILVIVKAVI